MLILRAKSDEVPLLMRVAKTVILPCGVGGIDQLESFDFRGREILHKNVEILPTAKSRSSQDLPEEKGESLQTAFPLYILAEGGDIIDGKRIDVLMECSGAERRQNDNLLIPYAH